MKKKGYMGKILHVDLTTGEIREEVLPDEVYEKYLGGMGLGAHILYNGIPEGADPLGPDNILGFLPGLPDRDRQPVHREVDGGGQVALNRRMGGCQLRRHVFACHQTVRV